MPDVGFPVHVDSVLLELASQRATGCLTLTEPEGEQSSVWFRDGLVYAVSVPGRRPLLGVRLMSSGALTPEALAEALEVQRTELQGWRLGELLVHLQFVDRAVVESFVTEQVRDQVADLLHWEVAESKFRNGKRTRQDVAPPIEVTDLLSLAGQRDARWAEIVPFIGGADGVPVLSTSSDAASDVVLGPYDWALLCKVDGVRTIADLADDCGFTVFEAGMVVVGLLDAGLVDIDNLLTGPEAVEIWIDDNDADGPTDDEVGDAVAKVAAALHDINLGPTVASPFSPRPVVHDVYAAPEPATGSVPTDATPRRSPFVAEPAVKEALADVVSLADEREARDGAEAERVEQQRIATLESERATSERAAAVQVDDEAARVEVAWAEAERLAAEHAEVARLEHERIEAERAERIAAEDAARAKAERVERERVAALEAAHAEAERVAAEEAARIEAERIAADEAERAEAERLAAEEAARIEAERIAAEEAARIEAERAERAEAERLEAERRAAEEAEREEAARLGTEAAERAAAERAAAEQAEQIAAALAEAGRFAAEDASDDAREDADDDAMDRHAVNAVFTELSLDPPSTPSVSVDPPADYDLDELEPTAAHHEHVVSPHDGQRGEPRIVEPELEPALAGARAEGADMASLLRELSSLGGGFDSDQIPGAQPAHVVSRPVQAQPDKGKKKKGFFGR